MALVDNSLPGLLAEIAEVAGLEAALQVAGSRGGILSYFPARPKENHWLSLCVGPEKAQVIAAHLASGHGGVELLVPIGPSKSKIARWRKIRDMIEAGHSKRVIARVCGVHERTVQNHRNNKVVTLNASLDQLDMFE